MQQGRPPDIGRAGYVFSGRKKNLGKVLSSRVRSECLAFFSSDRVDAVAPARLEAVVVLVTGIVVAEHDLGGHLALHDDEALAVPFSLDGLPDTQRRAQRMD